MTGESTRPKIPIIIIIIPFSDRPVRYVSTYLLRFPTVGGNGLILLKRLLRDSFSILWSQKQQENWDRRPNSSVVSAGYDMNPPPVFSGNVHYRGRVPTCGSSKLKTFIAQGKWSFDTTNAHDS